MERIKLDYEPLRAATARCDRAHIEVQAQKLRDRHMANVVAHAANSASFLIKALGRGILAWRRHHYEVSPRVNRLLNFIRM